MKYTIFNNNEFLADNRSKRKRNADRRQDFTVFAEKREQSKIRISPQLTLAAFQYLSTSKLIFTTEIMNVLSLILNIKIITFRTLVLIIIILPVSFCFSIFILVSVYYCSQAFETYMAFQPSQMCDWHWFHEVLPIVCIVLMWIPWLLPHTPYWLYRPLYCIYFSGTSPILPNLVNICAKCWQIWMLREKPSWFLIA